MTKNKKSNVKRNNAKKVSTKKVFKNEKKEVIKEEEINSSKLLKELVIIIFVIALIFGVVYLLTVGATKLGLFDAHYTKTAADEAIISYENIQVGTMFDRNEEEYYVVLADGEDNMMYLNALITNYKEKENALKLYLVDLSDGLNKSVVSDESSANSSKVSELKINDMTLIHVRNGQNIGSITGIDNISNVLK